jgi:DNA-directed RNA polymerase subunit RPC12/RpoP
MVVDAKQETVEEERFHFCMKCRTEIEKARARFCPECRSLVLFYTKKQISSFKNQKQKKVEEPEPEPKKPTKIVRTFPVIEGEEEFDPALPYPQMKKYQEEI